ncbi:hypothetical protein A2415_04380 [candidate division WWE3 bacterium RIFOXYC1_FULL_39_7]|uniref:Band 7 domain-containing protein n=2 Tax=Katanobacteria TaxID=422282 RepID=A0A1F4X8E9_UNCKA|nr:MAG: hypothetical protein A2415_04380 [candidate division WWE3 bacterium RIFOXYC1_FULL_39_7]OGC77942.1 MAG: hypothetical protein A2619_00785 [candidate division WWE3 bacterium RIFOXYD1_FULL_39_9]
MQYRSWWLYLTIAVIAVVVFAVIGAFTFFGYFWVSVDATHIGVETIEGRVTAVLPPGIHSNDARWADLTEVSLEQLPWCATDPEVITSDRQRLGFVVCGTVSRPGLGDLVEGTGETFYKVNNNENWTGYKQYYLNDGLLAGRYETKPTEDGKDTVYVITQAGLMDQLARQAMKVCVGARTFDTAVVGGSRDELRQCIDDNVSERAAAYGGLKVQNVTVPNVVLLPEVQQKFDDITQSRLDVELANQDALKEASLANQQLALESGKIRVEQGRIQELEKQKALTYDLERQALEAEKAVIEAQKANDLLTAQKDLEIALAQLEVERAQALAIIAKDEALATLYAQYPEYREMLIKLAWAASIKATDKLILPAGTDPMTILQPDGESGVDVVIPATP